MSATIHFDGAGAVVIGVAFLVAAAFVGLAVGWGLALWRNKNWRVRGFRHLIALSEMYEHFTIGDVAVAFDPHPNCAAERRRLFQTWRRERYGAQQDSLRATPDVIDRAS